MPPTPHLSLLLVLPTSLLLFLFIYSRFRKGQSLKYNFSLITQCFSLYHHRQYMLYFTSLLPQDHESVVPPLSFSFPEVFTSLCPLIRPSLPPTPRRSSHSAKTPTQDRGRRRKHCRTHTRTRTHAHIYTHKRSHVHVNTRKHSESPAICILITPEGRAIHAFIETFPPTTMSSTSMHEPSSPNVFDVLFFHVPIRLPTVFEYIFSHVIKWYVIIVNIKTWFIYRLFYASNYFSSS